MTKAVEAGMPKLRIEEAAARRQARIDRGEDVDRRRQQIPRPDEADRVEIRDIDNSARARRADRAAEEDPRRRATTRQRRKRRSTRWPKWRGAARAICSSARSTPTRARATVGEISDALEDVFTRHRAAIRSVSGVYGGAIRGRRGLRAHRAPRSSASPRDEGRRPRLLVVKLGQDGHDRGAKVIATAFADLGFDVDIGPLFQTPDEAARQAIENDVHVIGVSSPGGGHKTLVPQLIAELKASRAATTFWWSCGGVIPAQDYEFLTKAGVAAIFGAGHQHSAVGWPNSRTVTRQTPARCEIDGRNRTAQPFTAQSLMPRQNVKSWLTRANPAPRNSREIVASSK